MGSGPTSGSISYEISGYGENVDAATDALLYNVKFNFSSDAIVTRRFCQNHQCDHFYIVSESSKSKKTISFERRNHSTRAFIFI